MSRRKFRKKNTNRRRQAPTGDPMGNNTKAAQKESEPEQETVKAQAEKVDDAVAASVASDLLLTKLEADRKAAELKATEIRAQIKEVDAAKEQLQAKLEQVDDVTMHSSRDYLCHRGKVYMYGDPMPCSPKELEALERAKWSPMTPQEYAKAQGSSMPDPLELLRAQGVSEETIALVVAERAKALEG